MVESLVNGQLKQIGPGSVIFQASNQMHRIRNVGEAKATYHVFSWHSPGILKDKAKKDLVSEAIPVYEALIVLKPPLQCLTRRRLTQKNLKKKPCALPRKWEYL
jgi:hypothetical protein